MTETWQLRTFFHSKTLVPVSSNIIIVQAEKLTTNEFLFKFSNVVLIVDVQNETVIRNNDQHPCNKRKTYLLSYLNLFNVVTKEKHNEHHETRQFA